MSTIEINERIWLLIESIEKLQWPVDSGQEFEKDLYLGAVKYLDSSGDRKLFKIKLITQELEIRESGRESHPEATRMELLIGGSIVFEGTFCLLLEDENEWLYQGGQTAVFQEGPWIEEVGAAQKRLDLAIEAHAAQQKADQDLKAQKRLEKKIQKRKK